MTITEHAYERAKERCGWNHKALNRMLEKVIAHGKRHSDYAGNMRRWIDKVYLTHKSASKLLIYGNYVFIFIGDSLITVYNIPRNLIGNL